MTFRAVAPRPMAAQQLRPPAVRGLRARPGPRRGGCNRIPQRFHHRGQHGDRGGADDGVGDRRNLGGRRAASVIGFELGDDVGDGRHLIVLGRMLDRLLHRAGIGRGARQRVELRWRRERAAQHRAQAARRMIAAAGPQLPPTAATGPGRRSRSSRRRGARIRPAAWRRSRNRPRPWPGRWPAPSRRAIARRRSNAARSSRTTASIRPSAARMSAASALTSVCAGTETQTRLTTVRLT